MTKVLVVGDVMTDIVVRPGRPDRDRRRYARGDPRAAGRLRREPGLLAGEGGRHHALRRHASARRTGSAGGASRSVRRRARSSARTRRCRPGRLSRSFPPTRAELPDRPRREPELSAVPISLTRCLMASISCTSPATRSSRRGRAKPCLRSLPRRRGAQSPFRSIRPPIRFLKRSERQNFLEWTRGARFLFPNEDEAAVLAGASEPTRSSTSDAPLSGRRDQARYRWRHRRRSATADAGPCPAPTVEAVDTSGAGDAFLGGFLAAVLAGEGIEAALKRGVALGSAAVTTLGARP